MTTRRTNPPIGSCALFGEVKAALQRVGESLVCDACAPVATIIERAKSEILKDVADGRAPSDAPDFATLHDYVDANEYGGLCEEGSPAFPVDTEALEADDVEGYRRADRAAAIANTVQAALDAWIKAGGIRKACGAVVLMLRCPHCGTADSTPMPTTIERGCVTCGYCRIPFLVPPDVLTDAQHALLVALGEAQPVTT